MEAPASPDAIVTTDAPGDANGSVERVVPAWQLDREEPDRAVDPPKPAERSTQARRARGQPPEREAQVPRTRTPPMHHREAAERLGPAIEAPAVDHPLAVSVLSTVGVSVRPTDPAAAPSRSLSDVVETIASETARGQERTRTPDPSAGEPREPESHPASSSVESLLAWTEPHPSPDADRRSPAPVVEHAHDEGRNTPPDTEMLLRGHVIPELEARGLLAPGEDVDLSDQVDGTSTRRPPPRPGRVSVRPGVARTGEPTTVDAHTTEVHVHIDRVEVVRAAPALAPTPAQQPSPAPPGGTRVPSRLDAYLERRASGAR